MSATATPAVIAVGELLIDLISTNYATDLSTVNEFRRIPGGSPANMASNLVRLGKGAALVATVGEDDAGTYLHDYVSQLGLDTSYLRRASQPTTLILITRSQAVSNFEAYRQADSQILLDQLPGQWVTGARLFHTTCFALSRDPARTTILTAAHEAASAGVQLSIDANYAHKIWPDQQEARRVVERYVSGGALVKFSEVDWERLFGSPLADPAAAGQQLLDMGARAACLTLGSEGCYVCTATEDLHLPARPVEVHDTTGAGDAFWAGFLSAWLDEHSLANCARAGRALAEKKLTHFGPLPDRVAVADIYADAE